MSVPGQVCRVEGNDAEQTAKQYLKKHSKKYPDRVAYFDNNWQETDGCWLVVKNIEYVPEDLLPSVINCEEAIKYVTEYNL